MGIHYENLDPNVRACMICELERDIDSGRLYVSPRLTQQGTKVWPELLREAFETHNDNWLASELRSRGLLKTTEQRRTPKGGVSTAQVPRTAADTLAEGEFNRFYARGLCADVLAKGASDVEVYRGKAVQNPRRESEEMIGRRLPAQRLLDDLRTAQGVEPALGLPAGPNSGLSIRRVRD